MVANLPTMAIARHIADYGGKKIAIGHWSGSDWFDLDWPHSERTAIRRNNQRSHSLPSSFSVNNPHCLISKIDCPSGHADRTTKIGAL